MNIITWEWFIIIGLIVGWAGTIVGKFIYDCTSYDTVAFLLALPCTVILLASVVFSVILFSAQDAVKDKYVTYVETRTAYYYALLTDDTDDDIVIKAKVDEYNDWYSSNKSKLDNKWTLWGTTSYARKLDYIVEVN